MHSVAHLLHHRFGRGDDTVGNLHRAQIVRFELFELVLLLKSDKQFPVEQFEATASQSTVPSPLLMVMYIYIYIDRCIHIYIYIYVYIHIMYIHVYRDGERERERET